MDLKINLYGILLGFIILTPLGWKWEIDRIVVILSAVCIGFLSGFFVQGAEVFWRLGFLEKISIHIFFILGMSATLLLWRFFRDPERLSPNIRGSIVSPADGKILYIKKAENGQLPSSEKNGKKYSLNEFVQSNLLPKAGTLIGISMSFLDVHVNRAPVGGKIVASQRIEGGFLSLKRKDAVVKNERRLTIIDAGDNKIGVVQITSRLVRSIVTYVKVEQKVVKGQRIGMIRFGSQVDVYLPDTFNAKVQVKKGQKVKAGISILAEFKEKNSMQSDR